jgi:hypothetical protein
LHAKNFRSLKWRHLLARTAGQRKQPRAKDTVTRITIGSLKFSKIRHYCDSSLGNRLRE